MRAPASERFWSRVVRADAGCWEWSGNRDASGYGYFRPSGPSRVGVHRFSYEIHHGPIPEGLVIDHLCRNPSCVNPAHLEAVTQRENVLRGRGPSAAHARKTHCPRGHEYTPENTRVNDGKRRCRSCQRDDARERRSAISDDVRGGNAGKIHRTYRWVTR